MHTNAQAPLAGVPYQLAVDRAQRIKEIHYDLTFHLPAEKVLPVTGEEMVTFRLDSLGQTDLFLDFKSDRPIAGMTINGTPKDQVITNEHLQLPIADLKRGDNIIKLHFTAGNAALNRNTDFLYTLLVPDRARTLFPCFDQPDLKAVFTLSLTMPADWKVIANAPLKDSTREGDSCRLHFGPSDKISTYLFAFAAGKFSATTQVVEGHPMRFLYRETDSTKLRLSIDSIFRIEGQALQFLQSYTGILYPFQKFDFVAIPDFQFGGMEHVGAIQYKASTLFLDSGATREQYISRSNLLSHETAHMWFGDMVTMKWFNDVWMKEVFANFMADKLSNLTLAQNNYELKFLTDHYPAAYSIDRTGGAHPIRQVLDNLNEAGSLYGNIIYHKAPIVMRQLEQLMGTDAFRDGLRDYLKKYAGANASWPDLINALQPHTTIDLNAWNSVWVDGAGRPVFTYDLKTKKGKITDLTISQKGEDGSKRTWPQLFKIALIYDNRVEEIPVNSNNAVIHVTEAIGKGQPNSILFNSNGQGYGIFPVDEKIMPWLFGMDTNASALLRASAYINSYENMLAGRIFTPRFLLDFDRRLLADEPEELDLNILLDQLQSIYWRFLPKTERDSLAGDLEQDCWSAMKTVPAGNKRKLIFRTYTNIVLSKKGQDTLYTIWKTRTPPAGVILTEDDYTNLAAALALRDYPNSQNILDEQLSRISNADRKQRLLFLMPSLSGDESRRDSFFFSLQKPEARRRESLVLTAIGYLHHPLRAETAKKYLQPSLDWLEDIQRTGDVFFPQSWLQAGFGWCNTPAEADIVRGFLKAHPHYNEKLKAKILQATDNLFRAERLSRKPAN